MKYFLAHNEIDVFHYGKITEEQFVETGQPILLFFETEQELIDKLQEYNVEYNNVESQESEMLTPEMEFFNNFEELPSSDVNFISVNE